jgi:hypothetical protein
MIASTQPPEKRDSQGGIGISHKAKRKRICRENPLQERSG